MEKEDIPSPFVSFCAGAIAGLTVDMALFPLDTLKTRLQSENGFFKSGGFKEIYKGIGPTAAGSAPCAAIFFLTYNETKGFCSPLIHEKWSPINHIISACVAEIMVNLVKVPVEVVKQRRQTSGLRPLAIMREAVHHEGFLGLYRGFLTTIIRDIPFSVIQFPLWEAFKVYTQRISGHDITPADSALCGACSGAVAGAITTPLDLAKTRIMLANNSSKASTSLWQVLKQIYNLQGIKGLFTGFLPRTIFIFLGGGVFFGCYEVTKDMVESVSLSNKRS